MTISDHRQMLADSLLASRTSGLVTLNLDSTAVSQKTEMMSRFLVTETHPLITTGVHAPQNWLSLPGEDCCANPLQYMGLK